jgi:integrase
MDIRNPDIRRPHKGRAIVPMNRAAHDSLLEAREGALSEYVIEWAGKRVVSVKRGLKATARAAGIEFSVYPHLFRHSAAVHMAEAGIDMETIAQYLGHEDVTVTRRDLGHEDVTVTRRGSTPDSPLTIFAPRQTCANMTKLAHPVQ